MVAGSIRPSGKESSILSFTTKPIGMGTGLGLSMSYGIIRDHGGTIDFTSADGKRNAFFLPAPVGAESLVTWLQISGRVSPADVVDLRPPFRIIWTPVISRCGLAWLSRTPPTSRTTVRDQRGWPEGVVLGSAGPGRGLLKGLGTPSETKVQYFSVVCCIRPSGPRPAHGWLSGTSLPRVWRGSLRVAGQPFARAGGPPTSEPASYGGVQ